MMSSPTSIEPVKAMSAVRGSRTSLAPTVRPGPAMNPMTSGGQPASIMMSKNVLPMPRAGLAGLMSVGLPVTIAAVVIPHRMASGKFHGLMTTATPRGW